MTAIARFGFTLPQRGVEFGVFDVDGMLDLARRVDGDEALDALCIGDSILAKPRLDAIGLFGALAGLTSRVDLAVGCMASFPIRHPVVFAYQWASLDQLSKGRMKLAVCTGIVTAAQSSLREGKVFGLAADKERAPKMTEQIELCRRLWTETDVHHSGDFHTLEGVTVAPRPVQAPIPVWIASNPWPGQFFEPALRRVGRIADGWMTSRLFPTMVTDGLPHVQEARVDAGRPADGFPVVAYHNFSVGHDVATAHAEAKRFLDAYYGPVFTPEMIENWCACGPVEAIIDHLVELIEQGVTDVYLRACSWEQERHLAALVDEIVPAVRSRLS